MSEDLFEGALRALADETVAAAPAPPPAAWVRLAARRRAERRARDHVAMLAGAARIATAAALLAGLVLARPAPLVAALVAVAAAAAMGLPGWRGAGAWPDDLSALAEPPRHREGK